MCILQFTNQHKLLSHVINIHQFEKKFKIDCDICGLPFKKWKSFRQHIWRRHNYLYEETRNVRSRIDEECITDCLQNAGDQHVDASTGKE